MLKIKSNQCFLPLLVCFVFSQFPVAESCLGNNPKIIYETDVPTQVIYLKNNGYKKTRILF